MAGRAPTRGGQCPAGTSRGIRNPGLTRAAQLRQAKSAAFVKEQMAKEQATGVRAQAAAACELPRKARVPKFTRGPPPAEPRKIQMTKPAMTKAMLARMKHAEEFTKNLEKQRQPATFQKKTTRRPSPGPCDPKAAACPLRRKSPAGPNKSGTCPEAGPSSAPGTCPKPQTRRGMPPPQASSSMRRNSHGETSRNFAEQSAISEKTCELAQSMNAEVLQAEPVGDGPVQNIVIPPGAVSECRTTIVALPAQRGNNSSVANESLQLLSESLYEQDAFEAAAVNSRLSELQNARRDFVMAVANVGNNVINVNDNLSGGCSNVRGLYELPEAEHDMFRVEYGRDHPTVNAAREYVARTRAANMERENQMRIDREFARAARYEGGLRLDAPIEQDIMDQNISFEEDESGMIIPCASRMPPIPRKHVAAVTDAIGPDELERFFNPEKYPMACEIDNYEGPPPGRENLHPDLWEIDDPWYNECSQPDLIDFNDY